MTISARKYLKERPYIVTGTGHRPKHYVNYDMYYTSLSIITDSISKVVEDNEIDIDLVISGMALGFDTALAMCAIENNIPLHAYIPFVGQEYKWSKDMQSTYQNLIQGAEKVLVSVDNHPKEYREVAASLHKRNSDMLRDTDICFTFHRPDIITGGTVDAIKKAKSKSIYTVPIWPEYEKQAKLKKFSIKELEK
jgi:uncharacterized phage-like protein YoqJ